MNLYELKFLGLFAIIYSAECWARCLSDIAPFVCFLCHFEMLDNHISGSKMNLYELKFLGF